jgi:hypothetical protein
MKIEILASLMIICFLSLCAAGEESSVMSLGGAEKETMSLGFGTTEGVALGTQVMPSALDLINGDKIASRSPLALAAMANGNNTSAAFSVASDKLPKAANDTAAAAVESTGNATNVNVSANESTEKAAELPPINLRGAWDFVLVDSSANNINGSLNSNLTLKLNQINETVFGAGVFSQNGTLDNVTALGFVTEDRADLSMITVDGRRLFMLKMAAEAGSLNGNYAMYNETGAEVKGDVSGNTSLR